jgi:hypothetical protein
MSSDDLNPKQRERLRADVARMLRYLNRLVERMTRLGFPVKDPVYVAAISARAAIQDLHIAAHYATCTHGVGRPLQQAATATK